MHRVGARVQSFDGGVAAGHDIGVVAGAAGEHVDGAVAGQHVVKPVAGGVYRRRAGQRDVFHIGGQRVGNRDVDQVDALTQVFNDHVTHVVDHIGVVARQATQLVCRRGSAQGVGSHSAQKARNHGSSGSAGFGLCRGATVGVTGCDGDRLADLRRTQHQGGPGGPGNGDTCSAPLVRDCAQAIHVGHGVAGGQGLVLRGCAGDRHNPGGCVVHFGAGEHLAAGDWRCNAVRRAGSNREISVEIGRWRER